MKPSLAVLVLALALLCAACGLTPEHSLGEKLQEDMTQAVTDGVVDMSVAQYAAFTEGMDKTRFRVSGTVAEIDENDELFGINILGFGISVGKKNACYLIQDDARIRVVFSTEPELTEGETIVVTGYLSPEEPGTLVNASITRRGTE